MKEKEIIKKCLDWWLLTIEINEIQKMKNAAVKEQSYELAMKYREEEIKLAEQLPTVDQLRKLREKLNP